MPFIKNICIAAGVLAALNAVPALADDQNAYELTIKDHRFSPAEIKVPANKPVTLHVRNLDKSAEEFESGDLGIEKVIPAGSDGTIHLHPLKPGKYTFEGEYHEDTAKDVVIAE